jgi:cell division ATPase FtsA
MRTLLDSIRNASRVSRSILPKAKYVPHRDLSLLDLGAESLKAVVARREGDTIRILGYGIAPTRGYSLGGDRAAILTLAVAAEEALTTAEDHTTSALGHKIVPDDAVFCLPARFIRSQMIVLRQRRADPTTPISLREVDRLREQANNLLRKRLSVQDGSNETWEALAPTNGGMVFFVDGHPVREAVGLKGKALAASVLGIAVPSRIVSAAATIARRLEVTPYAVMAVPQSLTGLVPQREAILIDVGHHGTNVNLIRHSTLMATIWWPQGGEHFTTSLARTFRCMPEHAEELKRAYVGNLLSREDAVLVKRALEKPMHDWFDSLVAVLRTLADEHRHNMSGICIHEGETSTHPEGVLPGRIFVTGGGSLLPDLVSAVHNVETAVGIHFDRAVEVESLGHSLGVRRPSQPLLLNVPHHPVGDLLTSAIGLATSVAW